MTGVNRSGANAWHRRLLGTIALLAMVVGSRWPRSTFADSTVAAVLRSAGLGYILIDMLLKARAGYLRRMPHWTAHSWRRYLTACAIPAGALLTFAAMEAAVEFRLPIAGASQSIMRGWWVAGMMMFGAVGAIGLACAVIWLEEGDPSKQFTRFQRRGLRH
jgi:hypothetical protein